MKQFNPDGSCYEIFGTDNSETIVFIHGLGLNRQIWQNYIAEFSDRYQVLVYDICGHGESSPSPREPSLEIYSEQIINLLDSLDVELAALIGFSLGGMINRRAAMDHGNRVSALVILNSPHERSADAQKLVEQRASDTAAGGPGATLDATIERWFTDGYRNGYPDEVQQVRDWVLANDSEEYARSRWVLATGVIELIDPQPPITHPTLVMTCENDSGSTPKMSQDIAAEIVGSETSIIAGLQHMGLVEQPALFIEPMKAFLEKSL